MKLIFIVILIIAAAVYAGLNWETISSKLDSGMDSAKELKETGDELHERVQEKMDDAQEKMDDAKDKMDESQEAFEKLIDKVK